MRAVIFAELWNGGNELLLNLELIDVTNGSQLWGSQFRQFQAAGADCSERIVRRIVRQLQPVLMGELPKPVTRLEKKPPTEIRIMKSISAKRSVPLAMV